MKLLSSFFITFIVLLSGCSFAALNPLPTATYVDVNQYVGKWYTITSLPQSFTKKCAAQTAEYAIKTTNSISVLNTCIKADGTIKTIAGSAVVVNPKTNAELLVTFDNFWTRLFRVKGDYTIIKLDESYSTVLIGSKDRKSLWILSRTPYLNDAIKEEYVQFAQKLGFDTKKLVDSVY